MKEQLIGLLTLVLAGLIPVVRAYIKTKWTPERLAHVNDFARVAVRAAQKLGEDIPGTTGPQKLEFASELLVAGSKRLGFKLSKDEVVGFVHSALREMQQVEHVAAGISA